jgi:adenine-specific DNA-methyltransferase
MARPRKSAKVEAKDYRHSKEKRKNIPPAKIAAEGEVPKVKRVKYHYSPHLSPELRFDPTGKADRVMEVAEKAARHLTEEERDLLRKALANQRPWLEWAGKKEQHDRGWFDVDPVALHIHERVSAQAIVRAAMREDAQRELFADPELPYQQEVQFYRHDIDWANRLILGDSLNVMSSLARRENLAGKVQMIYIDPPYGINFRSNFQPEVGKRDVKDRADDLTREPEMVRAYRDTWILGVHSYLAYLRDRLILARELLNPGGSLFVQISDENLHRVRGILDDVFGADNFCGLIAFRTTGGQSSALISSSMDFLLWYANDREAARITFRNPVVPKAGGTDASGQYTWIEPHDGSPPRRMTEEELTDLETVTGWARVFRPDNLYGQGAPNDLSELDFEYGGRTFTCPRNNHWKPGVRSGGMKRLADAGRLIVLGNTVSYKRYVDDYPVYLIDNVWNDTTISGFARKKAYVVETSAKVIERCMLMTTNPGDLVLDPTCGSGTTAYVAEQWGRRWITTDTSRVAIALARQRLLTAKFDYYRLQAHEGTVAEGFRHRTVPHVMASSITRNQNLDPIFARHEPLLDAALAACNKALGLVSESARDTSRRKLLEKQAREGKRAITDADRRRWDLPKKGAKWEHWEVPFDTDPDWPEDLQDAVTAYRKAWRAKMDEVNACIAANADQEELVDQPEVVKGVVRVSGPFTVEGVRPEELSISEKGLFDGTPNEWEGDGPSDVRDEVQNLRAYLSRMTDLLRKDGVTFPNNRHAAFARLDALYEEKTGSPIHAEGIWEGTDEGKPNNVAVAFGPQYGPVTAEQVEELIRASKRYDELVIAGLSFDGEAAVAIQEAAHPKLKVHMAHIRPDVSPGMDGLLKETPNSQLFTVFGQPEILVKKHGKEEWQVELRGVDIFDPLKGEVRSTGAEKVAAWFLDSDYDGRCFCITQAFFPDQDAWGKIAKALGSQADPEAFDAFKGTVSLPFKSGKHARIAVKVIDPRGNEVMTFAKLER